MTTSRRTFLGLSGGLAATLALPRASTAQLVNKHAEDLRNGEFNWFPERSRSGPMLIIVSIPDQLVHVYRNDVRVAASTCSTGKPGHGTPTGVFKILEKDKHHHSSTYNNAPMPNMNRLTWSGVALHAGNLPGYPASHGCVRLPLEFSQLLFGVTHLGMTVVIADASSQPASVVHPGMVLGDYARHEFEEIDVVALNTSEGHPDHANSTSIVVSRPDRKVTVWDNGEVVAEGGATIQSPDQPFGERTFVLSGHDKGKGHLHWFGFGHGNADDEHAETLQRVKADPPVRNAIQKRMHHGMTVVVSDQPQTANTRTQRGFVVLGEGLY
ncbi:L,D-transpeptidase [Mesorhizobium sp. ZMM04-5]|uniref:L,D-transpeptidase n=1 Tax=Mesorhizobium marinum TaxID=3228790 RepID=A0ABV3R4X3_9HYPH